MKVIKSHMDDIGRGVFGSVSSFYEYIIFLCSDIAATRIKLIYISLSHAHSSMHRTYSSPIRLLESRFSPSIPDLAPVTSSWPTLLDAKFLNIIPGLEIGLKRMECFSQVTSIPPHLELCWGEMTRRKISMTKGEIWLRGVA